MSTQLIRPSHGTTARHPLQCRRRHRRQPGDPHRLLLRTPPRHRGARRRIRARADELSDLRGANGRGQRHDANPMRGPGCALHGCVVATARSMRRSVRRREDAGLWLVDPVNGATARWGLGPLCKVRVTHLADDATAIGFSWHHAVGDMQTLMHFMNAWAAAAAGEPLAEPLIVEDRAAYLDEHLPADGARRARGALPRARGIRPQRAVPGEGCAKAADAERLLRRRRNRPHARRLRSPDALVRQRRCVRACFRSAHEVPIRRWIVAPSRSR